MTAMELAPATRISNAKALQAQRDKKRKKEEELLFKYQKMFELDACLKSCKQVDDAMKNITMKNVNTKP